MSSLSDFLFLDPLGKRALFLKKGPLIQFHNTTATTDDDGRRRTTDVGRRTTTDDGRTTDGRRTDDGRLIFSFFYDMIGFKMINSRCFCFSFYKTHRKSSNICFFLICVPPHGRRRLLTAAMGRGGDRDQYSFHPSPNIRFYWFSNYLLMFVCFFFS